MDNYLSPSERLAIDAMCPAGGAYQIGDKIGQALLMGQFYKVDHKWYVDGTNGNDTINDGHSWQTAFKTIQQAVNSCGNGVGDIIFVAPMPSAKYAENVLILNHQSIKIIAPWGPWTTRLRVSDAITKYAITPVGGTATAGIGFIVLSRDVEICGFGIDGGGGYCGVYVGDGYRISASYDANAAGALIHDNAFLDASNYGVILDGCSGNVHIENNEFERFVVAGVEIGPGGSRTVQRPTILGNTFLGRGYGVHMYSDATTVGVQVIRNTFIDQGGYTMTRSCLFAGAGYHAFVGNYDCTNAGALGSATDFMSGNSKAYAMSAPKYMTES